MVQCTHDVAGWQHRGCIIPQAVTQSSAPEDWQNNFPKHVELTGIINKSLFLHLVGCLYYLYQWCTVKHISDNEIYLLIKYIKSVLWRAAKCLSYIEEARCLKVNIKRHILFHFWRHYNFEPPFWPVLFPGSPKLLPLKSPRLVILTAINYVPLTELDNQLFCSKSTRL